MDVEETQPNPNDGDNAEGSGETQPAPQPDDLAAGFAQLERENERLRKVAEKFDKRVKRDKEAEEKAAQERGEWERLHAEKKAEAEQALIDLDAAKGSISEANEFFETQVETGLKAIEDKGAREQIQSAISALPPMKRYQAFDAMKRVMDANVAATAPNPGGRPGRTKPVKLDRKTLAGSSKEAEEARQRGVLESLNLA